jgi:hypothetical protein
MRGKLIRLIREYYHSYFKTTDSGLADYLIANGVTVPVLCQNCTHHDTYTCPENRVWCNMLRRYMSLDGYCSYGERKNDEKLV